MARNVLRSRCSRWLEARFGGCDWPPCPLPEVEREVGAPGSECALRSRFLLARMSSRTIDSPKPVPFAPLVVKNGSKICFASSIGIPLPVSDTSIACGDAAMRSVPLTSIASQALEIRLVRARVSASGSPEIAGSRVGTLRSRSIPSGNRSCLAKVRRKAAGLMEPTSTGSPLQYASKFAVSAEQRSVARCTPSR